MRKMRFISPYFASIGLKEAFILFKALILAPFYDFSSRAKLHSLISTHFGGSAAFSYTSARGALASFLSAAGIRQGDEVLLSTFSCLAVPTAVISTGATPIYADIDPETLNVTLDTIKAAVTHRTRVIVVQHTLGSFAPVQEIIQFAGEHDILVVEDCALSIGTKKNGREVGIFGDAAIFSMELSKTISVGWGGVLIVNKSKLARLVAAKYENVPELHLSKTIRMAVQTIITGICYKPAFFGCTKYLVAIGFKLRLFKPSTPDSENEGCVGVDFISKLARPQTVLATHQWLRLDRITEVCHEHGTYIRNILTDLGYIPLGTFGDEYTSVSPRVSFLVADRSAVMSWFLMNGVELGSWFDGPLSPVPEVEVFNYRKENYPKASFVAKHIVNIPCHNRLSHSDNIFLEKTLTQYALVHPQDLKIQEALRDI